VFERKAYLNAGSNGPVPARAAEAARAAIERQASEGRSGKAMIDGLLEQLGSLRMRVAGLLGCDGTEVALTGSTTDGVNAVLTALDLRAGDEIVTSDEEHPGLLAPLAVARERHGIRIRVAPLRELAGAVGERTKLVPARTCPGGRATWWTAAPWRKRGRPCCSTARRVSAPCR